MSSDIPEGIGPTDTVCPDCGGTGRDYSPPINAAGCQTCSASGRVPLWLAQVIDQLDDTVYL